MAPLIINIRYARETNYQFHKPTWVVRVIKVDLLIVWKKGATGVKASSEVKVSRLPYGFYNSSNPSPGNLLPLSQSSPFLGLFSGTTSRNALWHVSG